MDKERLGKVLGAGMRHAARTAIEAGKAAAAPDPRPAPHPRPATQVHRPSTAQITHAAARSSRGFFFTLRHASRAVWQQVMGTLFAVFALYFLQAAITKFSRYQAGGEDRNKWFLGAAIALLFSWFSISSFVRAAKKPR